MSPFYSHLLLCLYICLEPCCEAVQTFCVIYISNQTPLPLNAHCYNITLMICFFLYFPQSLSEPPPLFLFCFVIRKGHKKVLKNSFTGFSNLFSSFFCEGFLSLLLQQVQSKCSQDDSGEGTLVGVQVKSSIGCICQRKLSFGMSFNRFSKIFVSV